MGFINIYVVSFVLHVIFLYAIVDVYFKSPIVPGLTPVEPLHDELSDRLVLLLMDGLRVETIVNHTTMPWLRSIANSNGRWGISYCRPPTVSRPGLVSIIAGIYEDPAAITIRYDSNPVDYDSFFNRTKYSWCWGDLYTVKHIIRRNSDHIFSFSEFFKNKNITDKTLDEALYQELVNVFNKTKRNAPYFAHLKEKKIALFLQFIEPDKAGHTYKPISERYHIQMKKLDQRLKEVVNMLDIFYNNDGKTTYLLTADHGLTDWGSHSLGSPHEIETPYIIWGAGVKPAKAINLDPETNMSLDHRIDIQQIDLAPLMATVLKVPVPVNSIGRLPADILNVSLANKAKALYTNSRQLALNYNQKRLNVEKNAVIPILFKNFKKFNAIKLEELMNTADNLLNSGKYEALIDLSKLIMDLSIEGFIYYDNYYQNTIKNVIALSFIGWTHFLLKLLLIRQNSISDVFKTKKTVTLILYACYILAFSFVFAQNLPFHFFLYFLPPIFFWWHAFSSVNGWIRIFAEVKNRKMLYTVFKQIILILGGLYILGASFHKRWLFSIPLLVMCMWPFFSSKRKNLPKPLVIVWIFSCALLSNFSRLNTVRSDAFIELVLLAGIIWLLILGFYVWKVLLPLFLNKNEEKKEIVLTIVQMVFLIVSLENIYVQAKRFDNNTPASDLDLAVAWIVAVGSFLIPLFHSRRLICRLMAIQTSAFNFYLLESVAHEGLFFVVFNVNVMCWMYIELLFHFKYVKITDYSFGDISKDFRNVNVEVGREYFRRAFFLLTYLYLAFFGTNNIAAINSFTFRWTTCFVTTMRPILIAVLIVLKLISPYLVLASCYRVVQHLIGMIPGHIYTTALVYSNIMALHLLYKIQNVGDYLEVATSISHFIIVQSVTFAIFLLNGVSKVLTE